mmetsp:Transcript_10520/g.29554  ORF Transcript_10520/g.29554 Transcript_10520/m.29554 type:complete len:291 (-) Transcript_10520:155-1027(-)
MPTPKPRSKIPPPSSDTCTAAMSSPSATAIATLSTLAAASSPSPSITAPSNSTPSSSSSSEKVEISKKRKAELKRCEATVKRLKSIISDGTTDHRYSALVDQLFESDWIGGDLADHYRTAVTKRKEEAEAADGNVEAMCDLGWWYAEGMHGCAQDEATAFEWYEKAARGGDEVAMGEAGHRLVDGVGTARNVRYGVALTLGAAQFGYEVACYNAGTYFQDGILAGNGGDDGGTCTTGNVPLLQKDSKEAKKWLEMAVRLDNNANGQSRLGEDMVKDAERRIAQIDDEASF